MNKRAAITSYLLLWLAIAVAVTWGMVGTGCPLWVALVSVYFLFVFANGSLAYSVRARRLRAEGKSPPPFLQYLWNPTGVSMTKEKAPKSAHVLASIAAALTGAFFSYCGIALAYDAEWSRITHPVIAATICLALIGMGVALFYLAWRLIAATNRPDVAT